MRIALVSLAAAIQSLTSFPAAAPASPEPEAVPLLVEFRLEGSDPKAPIATGDVETAPFSVTRFETKSAGHSGKLDLKLSARPQHDGSMAVELQLDEEGANGQEVQWQHTLLGKRGEPLAATVRVGDIMRRLLVTVR